MSSGRLIGLVSGKGGVGKTSLTVNLGIALNDFGKEVTVVDTDFSASNLGVHLGRYDHPVKIQNVINGNADAQDSIFRHPTGIKAISASTEIQHVEPKVDTIDEIMNLAKQESDFVLVDCPPGLNSTVEKIMDACDEMLVITMPTQSSATNAAQIVEKAKQLRKPILGTIVNMTENDPETELVDREIEMMTESHVMKSIPYDKTVKESTFENKPFVRNYPLSEASMAVKELAASLSGEHYERPSMPKLKRSVKKVKDALRN